MKRRFFRLAGFVAGVFLMALGIALSIRSGLGTTPISTVPVAVSAWLPRVSVGAATFLANVLFVAAQAALRGREFPARDLLQVPAVFLFGAAIDLWLALLGNLAPETWGARLAANLAGVPVLALGVWLCVSTRLLLMPGDGLAAAIGSRAGVPFAWAKVATDSSMVAAAAALGFATVGRATGIREGTLLAMLLVGSCVRLWDGVFARLRRLAARRR